jgi:hypothetical protein
LTHRVINGKEEEVNELTIDQEHFEQILEAAHNPSPQAQQLRKTWLSKKPEEATAASRRVLYGIVTPSLTEAGVQPNVIEEVEALFESTFQKVEQQSSRSGSRSREMSST